MSGFRKVKLLMKHFKRKGNIGLSFKSPKRRPYFFSEWSQQSFQTPHSYIYGLFC